MLFVINVYINCFLKEGFVLFHPQGKKAQKKNVPWVTLKQSPCSKERLPKSRFSQIPLRWDHTGWWWLPFFNL